MPRSGKRFTGDPTQVQSRDDRNSSRLSKRASTLLGAAGWSSSEQQELSIFFAQQRAQQHGDLPLAEVAALLEARRRPRRPRRSGSRSAGSRRARHAWRRSASATSASASRSSTADRRRRALARDRRLERHARAMVLRAFDADDGALAWREWHALVRPRARRRRAGGAAAAAAATRPRPSARTRPRRGRSTRRTVVSFVRRPLINVPVPTRVNLAGAEGVLKKAAALADREPAPATAAIRTAPPDAAGEGHGSRGGARRVGRLAGLLNRGTCAARVAAASGRDHRAAAFGARAARAAAAAVGASVGRTRRAAARRAARVVMAHARDRRVDALVRRASTSRSRSVSASLQSARAAGSDPLSFPILWPPRAAGRAGGDRRSSASSASRASLPKRAASSRGSQRRAAASSAWCCRGAHAARRARTHGHRGGQVFRVRHRCRR